MTTTAKQSTALLKACNRALIKLRLNRDMLACQTSAGFLTLRPGEQVQLFVKASRYSRKLLKTKPRTGGLWEEL